MLNADQVRAEISTIRQRTSKPFNVNFFCHAASTPDPSREAAWRAKLAPYYREYGLDIGALPAGPGRRPFDEDAADILNDVRPAIVSFHFGLPDASASCRMSSMSVLGSPNFLSGS